MKTCKHCNENKNAECYHKDNKTPDGLFYICKDCVKKRDKRRYDRNTRIILEAKQGPCFNCGEDHPPEMLDFHHVVPSSKSFGIGGRQGTTNGRACSEERLREELNKCVVLCKKCHKEVHYGSKRSR